MEQLKLDAFTARDEGFVTHPNIKPKTIRERAFQIDIAEKAKKVNTLVVIPTGLGKTVISAMVTADVMGRGKILMLAPTRPLVLQHYASFNDMLVMEKSVILTGKTTPQKRADLWKENPFIFSTPQVVRNDIVSGKYTLEDVALIIFDEAHRAVGDYAYVEIASLYTQQRKDPLILGLTASPGAQKAKIKEVMDNLHISNVEARVRQDEDVMPYVKEITIDWIKVELTPEMERVRTLLEEVLYEKVRHLKNLGLLRYKKDEFISKKDLLELRRYIPERFTGPRAKLRFAAYLNQALAISLYHALELLETQGVHPLRDYLRRMFERDREKRSERILCKDQRIVEVYDAAKEYKEVSHPKLKALAHVLGEQLKAKNSPLIIVFAQYRDTITSILNEIKTVEGANPVRFVGQGSRTDKGLKQEEQKRILDMFRRNEFNILVASSVAEEGLDIPAVDMVVFYEPIPSEIRSIQRKGRTGRSEMGKVVILITKNSKDEAYLWAERNREKKMHTMVKWLREAR